MSARGSYVLLASCEPSPNCCDLLLFKGSSLIKELRDSRNLTHWELMEPPGILNRKELTRSI